MKIQVLGKYMIIRYLDPHLKAPSTIWAWGSEVWDPIMRVQEPQGRAGLNLQCLDFSGQVGHEKSASGVQP